MPSKEAIKVYLRTRPTADVADDGGMALDVAASRVTLLGKRREDFGAVVHQREERTFKFSGGILHDATQEQVYAALGAGMVSSVLQGVNATVMCYGQTGAGKTFTMTGGHGSYRHRGLVPRALADLFKRLSRETGVLASCEVSYAEIYNELVVDLLRPQTPSADLVVTDDPERGVVVKNLTLHSVTSEEEAMRLLFEGEANRAVAEHKLNRASSRSHTVFTVSLELRRGVNTRRAEPTGSEAPRQKMLRAKLNLVDLAGSERLDKTLSAGSVAREAQHINKSLSFLEQVIIALGDKRREHVPYRSSKLTHVLKDSLGGNCRTALVANVWGESAHVEETAGTCEFARRMMQVEIEPDVNVMEDPATKARRLEAEVAALTRQLRHARGGVKSLAEKSPSAPEEEMDELARDFYGGRARRRTRATRWTRSRPPRKRRGARCWRCAASRRVCWTRTSGRTRRAPVPARRRRARSKFRVTLSKRKRWASWKAASGTPTRRASRGSPPRTRGRRGRMRCTRSSRARHEYRRLAETRR